MAGSLKFDTWLNDDDTENFKCRAFCNFNGTGTVAIRASGNVSSITDNSTGNYTVNFTTDMPDVNYSALISSNSSNNLLSTLSVESLSVLTREGNNSAVDAPVVSVAIFR